MALVSNRNTNMCSELKRCINNAEKIYMNVSFIRDSGLKLIIEDLKDAKNKGKEIKILTSDYMNVTEPNALYRLLDFDGIKIYDNKNKISFHSKAYIFKYKDNRADAYIGSSNISKSALTTGVEWNENINGKLEDLEIKKILSEFEELYENTSFDLSLEWLRKYEKNYRVYKNNPFVDFEVREEVNKGIEPIKIQIPALYELSKTREEGYNKAMVVVGTGLGKTYLSVFDSLKFKKILFVVHREEILQQAKKSFEKVHGDNKTYGFFKGNKKEVGSDITFASIATLGKKEYLNDKYFKEDYFDYIIVDEIHHSTAKNYQKLLNYFKPKFLLGLTATPERQDNGDVYKVCDYNIAYECNFVSGINNGWLVPFEYFGIYDDIDYDKIPWRNGKYSLEELEESLSIEERAEKIFLKYKNFRKNFTLGFCASVRHAHYMAEYFNLKNIVSVAITGEMKPSERRRVIKDFEKGKIQVLFVVDVFNEGVDIPKVDTIMFLRPTTSYTVFIQQLGRGLRTAAGKEKLRVLDFVGNYKGAELKPSFLIGEHRNKHILPIDDNYILPEACTVNFDFKLIDYYAVERNKKKPLDLKLEEEYQEIKIKLNKVPTILEIYTYSKYPVSLYIHEFKTWYNFVKQMGDLTLNQKLYSFEAIDFLKFLEKTSMTKSYKIPLLLSVFKNNLTESVTLEEVGKEFKEFYSYERHGKDLNNKKHSGYKSWEIKQFSSLAKNNPIKYITADKEGKKYFEFINNIFSLKESLFKEILNEEELHKDILERIEYRKNNFFSRKYEVRKEDNE